MLYKLTKKEEVARAKICLPLDGLDSLAEIEARVEELAPYVGLFKIGKESFTRFGQIAVDIVHAYGAEVFLDLKYHDIPATVKGAAKAASEMGVYMFNVHASGGYEMMKAAIEGARAGSKTPPKVIAVTVLTSIDEKILNSELRIPGKVSRQVLQLSHLAFNAGLDGIVCSALDLVDIVEDLPKDFMYVTPGIKGPNVSAGSDQKRVATPSNAVKDGSDILVIGRAITGPDTVDGRQQAAYEVLQDIAKTL